jgi:hypothetical protein
VPSGAPPGAGEGAGQRLCLHLGPHRTATTHLQQALAAARPALEAAGLRLLLPRDLRGTGALPLEAVAAGDPVAEARFRAGAVPGPAGLLLSEENLLGPALRRDLGPLPYPQAADRLSRLLAAAGWDAPVRLLLALRPPADWLVSLWSQRLAAGHFLPFGRFAAGIDPARLGWADLVARLLAVPGVAGCTLWRLADYPALAPAILAEALPPDAVAQVRPAPARANPGLTAAAVALIAAGAPGRDRAAQRALVAAARAQHPEGPAVAPFAPALLAEAAAAHAADLARLAGLPGVRILGSGAHPGP